MTANWVLVNKFAVTTFLYTVIRYCRLSGLSPFMGDNDSETLANVTAVEWDFEDEAFDVISEFAKDFIKKLLVKRPRLESTADLLSEQYLKNGYNWVSHVWNHFSFWDRVRYLPSNYRSVRRWQYGKLIGKHLWPTGQNQQLWGRWINID